MEYWVLWAFIVGWFMAYYGSYSARRYSRKMAEDAELLRSDNKDSWYRVSSKSHPDPRFVPLHYDGETREFVESSIEKSDCLWTQIYHNLARLFLGLFYSQTDVNGILKRGSMFVLSSSHLRQLLPCEDLFGRYVDLGAGDGECTLKLKPLCQEIYATEASSVMRSVLSSKGIAILDKDNWFGEGGSFDVISCFNLLDRCEKPLTMIRDMKRALNPDGYVVLALVYPFKPYVEFGQTVRPLEELNVSTESFLKHIQSVEDIFLKEGFRLVSYSRVPYLCEGDLYRSVYSLDDSIFVFKHS